MYSYFSTGVGEVLKEMPDDQMTDSLRKLCYLHVQPLNQVGGVFVTLSCIAFKKNVCVFHTRYTFVHVRL